MPARAGCYQERIQINRELSDELAVLRCIFARFHIAATAPGLIADAPILHAERLFVAIRRALVSQTFGSRWSIAIRDPIVELPGCTRTDVRCEVRFRADQSAKPDELMDAKLVGLSRMDAGWHSMLPKIVSSRTPGRGTDAVAPMITVGEATTRPA